MDLNKLDFAKFAEQGADVEIIHPVTGKGTGIWFNVTGRDSDKFRRRIFAKANESAQQQRLPKSKRKKEIDLDSTPEDVMADQFDDLAFLVNNFWHFKPAEVEGGEKVRVDGVEVDGAVLPYSHENAVQVITRFAPIYEQLTVAVKDRALFTPDSALN